MWNNIQPGMQGDKPFLQFGQDLKWISGQFEKYGQGTIQSLGTNYDYTSIMHYGSKACNFQTSKVWS